MMILGAAKTMGKSLVFNVFSWETLEKPWENHGFQPTAYLDSMVTCSSPTIFSPEFVPGTLS